MKTYILILTILGASLLSASATENYSCRDSKGRLHVADNKMNLPEECRSHAVTSDSKDPGKVNYVPATRQSSQSKNDFNRAVDQEQREIDQRKRNVEIAVLQAEKLATSYESAVLKRKDALRSKSYGFRNTIIQADQEMQSARQGKELLIEELKQIRLTTTQQEQIETFLNKIQN